MTDASKGELAVRLAAMAWLAQFGPDATFRYEQLAQFQFDGERIPLTDRGRGIRKPAHLRAALSFSTVFTPPTQVPPYQDLEGQDGRPRYKMRGTDPRHPENVALRAAMEGGLPLIWFVGVASGVYLARYPVYLVDEEQDRHQFVLAMDQAQRHLGSTADELDRRYSEQITSQRLHQPLFRARVLAAYERRCAMCRLRHASLLDASHILGDRHAMGQPVVPNGLALCKIHHAAFDQHILGVSPDLRIDVRRDILDEVDGPMLKYGIQALAGERLTVPRQRASAPDRARLEIRYAEFRAA
jgi:putative restriction endonuclease